MGVLELDLKFALIAGIAAVTMVVYLLGLIVAARALDIARRIQSSQVADNWNDLLLGHRTSVTASLARLKLRDMQDLVERWNAAFMELPGRLDALTGREPEKRRLRRIASDSGLEQAALLLLRQAGRDRQVAAITSLGFMRSPSGWNVLVPLVRSQDPYISLAALTALVRIDELRAAPFLTLHFSAHPDWPEHALARLIGEVSEATRETLVLHALAERSVETAARIFGGLERAGHPAARRLLDRVLESGESIDDVMRYLYATTLEEHIERIGRAVAGGRERARMYASSILAPDRTRRDAWESEPPWVRALAASMAAGPDDAPRFA